MDKTSREYFEGYTQAIVDIMDFLDRYRDAMYKNRLLPKKYCYFFLHFLRDAYDHRKELIADPAQMEYYRYQGQIKMRVKGSK